MNEILVRLLQEELAETSEEGEDFGPPSPPLDRAFAYPMEDPSYYDDED